MPVHELLTPTISVTYRGRFHWAGYFVTHELIAEPPDPEFSYPMRRFAGYAWTERGARRKTKRAMQRRPKR